MDCSGDLACERSNEREVGHIAEYQPKAQEYRTGVSCTFPRRLQVYTGSPQGVHISSRGAHGVLMEKCGIRWRFASQCLMDEAATSHELKRRCEPEALSARSLNLLMECRGLVEVEISVRHATPIYTDHDQRTPLRRRGATEALREHVIRQRHLSCCKTCRKRRTWANFSASCDYL